MAVSVNLGKALDKAYEDSSLEGILAAPPSALAGLTEKHDGLLSEPGIKTVRDLGSNKYFAVARGTRRTVRQDRLTVGRPAAGTIGHRATRVVGRRPRNAESAGPGPELCCSARPVHGGHGAA